MISRTHGILHPPSETNNYRKYYLFFYVTSTIAGNQAATHRATVVAGSLVQCREYARAQVI